MKKARGKRLIFLGLVIFLGLFLFCTQASALDVGLNEVAATGLGTQDIRVTIANLIRIAMGLLGIVAVVLIIIGGVMYATSMGEPEKIDKAKKLLIGAIIGLVIILTAFAIASFIINALLGGGNFNVVIIPPPHPPGGDGIGFGCNDPNSKTNGPYICKLSPSSAVKGDFVTILGGKFQTYSSVTSRVYFLKDTNKIEATIVLCNGNPSWANNQIVVEVPNNLPYDAVALNDFQVIVETRDGSSADKPVGGLPPADQFILTAGQPRAGIACIVPDRGKETTAVDVYGKRFGSTQNDSTLRFNNNKNATVTDWADEQLVSSVPGGAIRGEVFARVGGLDSNGYYFIVTCDTNADCGTSCCYQGYWGKECADANYCLPGEGESCDTNTLTPACEPGACQSGLICDNATCLCKIAGLGSPCDADNNPANGCQLDNNKCGQGFYCSATADPSCTCQYLPRIDAVVPDNGAIGNFITIWGRGFGNVINSNTKVIFLGGAGDADDKVAILPANCAQVDLWQDSQVIVQIPDGAISGPLKLVNPDGLFDTTADDYGWKKDFVINEIVRPGLCGTVPPSGGFGQEISILGINFGTTISQALIGGTEFDNKANWNWTNDLITSAKVPNLSPATLPVQVKVGTENSNPVNFVVTLPVSAPKIDYIDPISGPTGQYVTIFGSNFGAQIGNVRFNNGETDSKNWLLADTNFPAACSQAGYWHDSYIVVKVPNLGAIYNTQIIVETKENLLSNIVEFKRCVLGGNCVLRPGVCAIVPDQGPVGTKGVTMYGETFGDYGASCQVNFWQNKSAVDAGVDWSKNKVGSGSDGKQGLGSMTVPEAAITGPAQLVDSVGVLSNKILFTVADCRADTKICSGAKPCCDQRDGVCKTQTECAIAYPPMCIYAWSFTTGKIPPTIPPPQVIEDIDCTQQTQSPTPWKKTVDNCTNIWISARFNQKIDITTLNNSNIEVRSCGTTSDFDYANCLANENILNPLAITDFAFSLDAQTQATGFNFQPDNSLAANTWYQVILRSGEYGIKSTQGLQLDGNFDNLPGGDYIWYFKTRNTAQACDVDKVVVAPYEALIEKIDQTQDYNAFALAANCNILDGNAYDWNWYKVYSDGAVEEHDQTLPNHGIAKISELDVLPPPDNGKVDYKQTATPLKQGLVYVGAEVFADNADKNRQDEDNQLVIDLKIPEIDSFYPTNGLVRPELNTYVTLYGKNFGDSQGSSQVLFEDVPALLADCADAWSDTIIKVMVPQAKLIGAGILPTYVLPSPEKQADMVLFYDFEEAGKVIVKDKVNGNDGEIKGVGQKVRDQFGQALSFNGSTDYIKLPNTLNPDSGSLELWFKPTASGTLFSASDSTTNNLFALGFDSANNSAGLIKTGQMNQLVYTYDGSNYTLYVNGFKFTSLASDLGLVKTGDFLGANKTDILIGAKNVGGLGDYFKGTIDNFAIYSKVLTEDEVSQRFGLGQGQILLLHFDEDGSQITDSSANKFSGLAIADPSKSFRTAESVAGKAISFNNDNFINITNDPSLVFGKGITIEGWFKIADTNPKTIFEANNLKLGIVSNDNLRFTAYIFDETNPANSGSKYVQIGFTSNNFRLSQWNYFAAVYDGQNLKIYLNGDKAEYTQAGRIFQAANFNNACLAGCAKDFNGSLDEVAIYNQALTEAEINSRVGARDNSFLKVITGFGEDSTDFNNDNIKDPGETFKFSENVYPFLCSLQPNFGLAGTKIAASGANFGDSNKTNFEGKEYGVGSYVHFEEVALLDILKDSNISSWSNKLLNIINPYSDIGRVDIPVSVSIDPYSEPYQDTDNTGSFTEEPYADTNKNSAYDKVSYTTDLGNLPDLKSNTLPFYLPPVITSITPNSGPVKTWVTISGYNFGNERGKVFFYNNQETDPTLPPAPCANNWTNTQIIVVVPDLTETGNVYLVTAKGLESNRVKFTVNNNPLGAGLCQIVPSSGAIGINVTAQGDRFEDSQGDSQLVFTNKKTALASIWTNRNITATVPTQAISGGVVVTKKMQVGQVCAGFHIGAWCPVGKYEIAYQEVASNPVNFDVLPDCRTGFGPIGTDAGLAGGFPIKPFDASGPSLTANTGKIASDGTYLYTTAAVNTPAYPIGTTMYKIGTGYNNTQLGKIYEAYSNIGNPWGQNALLYLTYAKNGQLYNGGEVYQRLNVVKFDEVNKTWQWVPDPSGPLLSSDGSRHECLAGNDNSKYDPNDPLCKNASNNPCCISAYSWSYLTSNGDYLFNIYIDSVNKLYKFKVFKLNAQNKWLLHSKFDIALPEGIPPPNLSGSGFFADDKYIYFLVWSPSPQIQAIDWQNQRFAGVWNRSHKDPWDKEYGGQYDWVNKVYWLGEYPYAPAGAYNKIFKYPACPFAGKNYCKIDADCLACGQGKSSCIKGICSPYINYFSPLDGVVGTWVSLHGCYFGCEPGQIYFYGPGTAALRNEIGFYPFITDASDFSGLKNNGTLKNGATISVSDQALSLDGVNDYFEVSDNTKFNFDKSDPFSLALWFKSDRKNDEFMLAKMFNNYPYRGYSLILQSDGKILLYFINDYPSNFIQIRTITTGYNDNNWHHLVMTYDGSAKASGFTLYLDGVKKDVSLDANTLTGTTLTNAFFSLGARTNYTSGSLMFKGSIDDVFISQSTLSEGEVYPLFQSGRNAPLLNNFNKQGLLAREKDCGNTWRCSANGANDEVVVEVPNKNTLPNMDCPNDGTCPPAGYDPNDASDGPILLQTAAGLTDYTLHIPNDLAKKLSPNFDVNTIVKPNICKLVPDYGNRGVTVKVIGENFNDAPEPTDYVNFEPSAETFGEPFLDILNAEGLGNGLYDYDLGEAFIDINSNLAYSLDLNRSDYTFQITDYINKVVKDICPINGWDKENICFGVPLGAAGEGTTILTAVDEVAVSKNKISDSLNFSVTFGSCGNQVLEPEKGEMCDADILPDGLNCADYNYPPDCLFKCTTACQILVCEADGTNCIPLWCGNGVVDPPFEQCDNPDLGVETCASLGLVSGTLSCLNTCQYDTSGCTGKLGPKVIATAPSNGEQAFCRNGIADLYFDSVVDPGTIEIYQNKVLVDRNIKLEACTGSLTKIKNDNFGANILAYFKNILTKLFGAERQALAQVSCTPFANDEYSLKIGVVNNKTIVSVITKNLLDPGQDYRLSVIGGDQGVKNLTGGRLDNSTTPIPDLQNYLTTFKTRGTPGDLQSGICDVQWIDVMVYRQAFTDPAYRNSEYRSDDLFTCAGKDDCNLETDFDQDPETSGNQHIYLAVAKFSGNFTLKATYQWSRNDNIDPQRALEIYSPDDLAPDANKVKNIYGYTLTTAKPIKEATAQLVIEAQAEGSLALPVQRGFKVYLLLCENPWPSISEKFPISSIINAYNFQTYYCRDAGTSGPEGDLPAARILAPDVKNLNVLENTDFEYGNLSSWTVLTGNIFDYQPIKSNLAEEGWIINTLYGNILGQTYFFGNAAVGVLSSQAFLIEGDELKFKIGGSNNPWPANRMSSDINNTDSAFEEPGLLDIPVGVTAVTLDIRETTPSAIFYVRLQETGDNTNLLREKSFDISAYQGKIGIIRVYDNNYDGYLNFDDLRQFKEGLAIPIRF